MQNHRTAQANNALLIGVVGVVVTLIALGVIISSGFKTLGKLNDLAEDNIAITKNESFTWTNATKIKLTQQNLVTDSESVWNLSLGATCCYKLLKNSSNLLDGLNYSMDYAGGYIRINNVSNHNNTWNSTMNISYSFKIGSQERNITQLSGEGVKQVSDMQSTFAIVIAVGILITALLIPLMFYIMGKL